MADNTENTWWYELKVNFYIENGKGENLKPACLSLKV